MKSKGPPNPMPLEGVQTIAIGGSAIGNAFGVGSSVTITNSQFGELLMNCTNLIQQQQPGERKNLLEALTREGKQLIENLPEEKKDEAAQSLEMLVKQATQPKPNRKWYSFSADGLLEAAKWAKDFTGNIAGTIVNLGKSLWPDFSLTESK